MHPDYDYDGAAAGIGCARQRHACLQSRFFGHSAMAGRVPHITAAGAFRECRQLVLRQSWHHFVSQERTLSQYIDLPLTSRLRRASASWKRPCGLSFQRNFGPESSIRSPCGLQSSTTQVLGRSSSTHSAVERSGGACRGRWPLPFGSS